MSFGVFFSLINFIEVIIREIVLTGKNPSNVTFGGKDGRTVYVTLADQGNLESFSVKYPGKEWKK